MPHASQQPDVDPPNPSQALTSVNGGNPSAVPELPETLTDIVHLVVHAPDGKQRVITLDEKLSMNKLSLFIEKVCRQFGIDDAMEAVVSSPEVILDSESADIAASRIISGEKANNGSETESEDHHLEEESPLYIAGKLALCSYCGYLSKNFLRCQRCKRKFNNTVKAISDKVKKSGDRSHHHERRQRKKKLEESECVTILSSDEEDNKPGACKNSEVLDSNEFRKSVLEKEPIITETTEGPDCSTMSGGGLDLGELVDSPDTENCLLECRTVRIGSYKVIPCEKVLLTTYGLKIRVPNLKGESTTIKILRNEIVKVLVCFGVELPVMFYYVTAPAGRKIRAALHMSGKEASVYFDPTSAEEVHKRITLLPDQICEESRLFIRSIYDHSGLLGELDHNEANDILVRAANQKDTNNAGKKSSSSTSACQLIQQIMIYPPPPIKGGISINTEDYACLGEDQFLNDVIIDFYLKYLVQNILSEEDRKRTHVFSSFFYKRLTLGPKGFQDNNPNLNPAEKRHARVKGWTKGVNIFAKDFIVIPINESSHWFLAIICYPGLQSCVRMADNQPIEDSGRREAVGKKKSSGNIPSTIGETTITVVSQQQTSSQTISLDPDCEERDEAEGNDEDLEPNSSDDEGKENGESGNGELMDEAFPRVSQKATQVVPKPTYPHQEAIKQPCILVFDSLMGASRSRVIATLREYLHVEYKVKHKGNTRDFSKNYVKGAVPKVPQQTNFTDCGLFVLQYVEEFFRTPLTDYRMPMKLQEWFVPEIVSRKRYEIQQLLHKLMDDQGVDKERINLPRLNLRPDGGRYSEGEGEDDSGEMDEGGEEEELEEEEEDERGVEEEEDMEDSEGEDKEEEVATPQQVVIQQQQTRMRTPPVASPVVASPAVRATPVRGPRTPVVPPQARLPVTPLTVSSPTRSPRLVVRPNVMLEPSRPSVTPQKRNIVLPHPEVTIRKKGTASPAPPATLIRTPRMTPPPTSSPLPRISSSIEITKRKV